jgi:hypothetical protein
METKKAGSLAVKLAMKKAAVKVSNSGRKKVERWEETTENKMAD